ncbi:MAG: helix-turn-helix domain-containing protein [Anaerolineaceae bacterium]|nr:MAG: helix-turn-helix domain-containing protein [Anaerolineaceae bacterium]
MGNGNDQQEWVSLRKAAEILGVHPATVRNWADRGELTSRRTPGGHRRFRRADLEHLAQTQSPHDVQPAEVKIIIQNALGQTRMQVGDGQLDDVPWYAAMSEKTRGEMRTYGRAMLDALREFLADGAPDESLSQAIRLGKEYAVVLTDDGLSLPQALRGFFYFSDLILNSILTWSEITQPRNASEWANLLRQVNNFMNAMMLSLVEYYEEE